MAHIATAARRFLHRRRECACVLWYKDSSTVLSYAWLRTRFLSANLNSSRHNSQSALLPTCRLFHIRRLIVTNFYSAVF